MDAHGAVRPEVLLELLLTWPLVLGEREVMEADAVPMADTKCHSEASQSQMEIITKAQMETAVQSGTTARPDAGILSMSWKPLTSSVYLA